MSPAGSSAQQAPPDPTGSSTFIVLIAGTRVGTETATLSRSGSGWMLAAAGRLIAPFDLVTNRFEVVYGADWQPERLTVDGLVRGVPMMLTTSFGLTTAMNDMTQGLQHAASAQQVSPRAVVLPTNIFGAYEALALRMASTPMGARVPLYIAPTSETGVTVNSVTEKRVSIGNKTLELRAYQLTIGGTSGALPAELWVDARGRMARLSLPASATIVIRDDLATVMAREERIRNPGDEDVFVGANGFTLGATLTKPAPSVTRASAVVIVSAPGPQDRDHTVFGVSVFGQLAGGLARAGQFVVRYDVRGIGRSGGRTESARLAEYSDDALAVVAWLRRRKDVDPKRIMLVGYGDAGPLALLAASADKNIAGLVLIAAPGGTGREATLAQQERLLAQLPLSAAERSQRLDIQNRMNDAVVSGRGWEGFPADVRAQADTAWFKSWLQFDPAPIFRKLTQPVLILHGALDSEVAPSEADRLAQLSQSRQKTTPTATKKVVFPGLNHLLVPSKTGTVDEYPLLETPDVSPDIASTVTAWVSGLK
jgi:pimeloyl-ACP methyl ester carboxylesterase